MRAIGGQLQAYATGAIAFTKKQLQELNVCWNTAYRTIFRFNKLESVKSFIFGLGRLNLLYIIKLHRIRFLHRVLSLNHTILYNLFFVYFTAHWRVDDCLAFTLCTLSEATRIIYEQFATIALSSRDIDVYLYVECCRFFFRSSCYSAQYFCGK